VIPFGGCKTRETYSDLLRDHKLERLKGKSAPQRLLSIEDAALLERRIPLSPTTEDILNPVALASRAQAI